MFKTKYSIKHDWSLDGSYFDTLIFWNEKILFRGDPDQASTILSFLMSQRIEN